MVADSRLQSRLHALIGNRQVQKQAGVCVCVERMFCSRGRHHSRYAARTGTEGAALARALHRKEQRALVDGQKGEGPRHNMATGVEISRAGWEVHRSTPTVASTLQTKGRGPCKANQRPVGFNIFRGILPHPRPTVATAKHTPHAELVRRPALGFYAPLSTQPRTS